jgi:hypothetical protein
MSGSEQNRPVALLAGMQWIEALINVSALAGFVGVANCWTTGRRGN